MLKQPDDNGDDEGQSGENGKTKHDIEPASLPTCKRASNDEWTGSDPDGERKRSRVTVVNESVVLSESSVIDERPTVIVPQNDVEASSGEILESGQLQMTGTEPLSEQSKEAKLIGSASGRPSAQEKAVRNTIVTAVTAEVAEDRGSRHTMEDAWVLLPQAWLGTPGKLRLAHFAIYDGHGGRHAAEYARAHLHANILSAGLPRELMDIKGVKRAIFEGFKNTDEGLLRESLAEGWQDGATVVSVWVLGQMVFVANLGDAKAVLARSPLKREGEPPSNPTAVTDVTKEAPLKGLIVTKEHKAIFPQERARIEKAGGFVEANGRLLGRLEVSRAFGDRNFKKRQGNAVDKGVVVLYFQALGQVDQHEAGVIAVPDIQKFELSERERFLILGCDGLWGVFGPSDAVEFVAGQLKDGVTVGMACRRLVREAVRERKCKDNCTALVIKFEHTLE